ncbi:MAG: hypothetical protein FWG15_05155 [Propionibacteriaceae bacterium]|nr:hypothetical protein [Propionibacteriaceae bacterium]
MRFKRVFTYTLIIVIVALTNGCSLLNGSQSTQENDRLSGPWADDFNHAFEKASTDLGKAILADGQITEQEFAEIKEALRSCLVSSGFEVFAIGDDGSLDTFLPFASNETAEQTSQRAKELSESCQETTDWLLVSDLYYQMNINPDNVDFSQLMADCLIRTGLRPSSYTASNYINEFESGDIFLEFESPESSPQAAKFWECNSNPLGTH